MLFNTSYSMIMMKKTGCLAIPSSVKSWTVILIMMIFPIAINAQSLDLYGFSGYTFGHSFPIDGGRAKIYDGHTFGGAVGIALDENYSIELLYSRQPSRGTAQFTRSNVRYDEPIASNYVLIGGQRYFSIAENAQLFSGLKIGSAVFSSRRNNFDNYVKFAGGLSGGVRYFITEEVGLRMQAHLLFPITNLGANLWWNPGAGTSVGVTSYTSIVQFGFTGGMVLRLNN